METWITGSSPVMRGVWLNLIRTGSRTCLHLTINAPGPEDRRATGPIKKGNAMNVPTISTKLTEALHCRYPIICAGMGGPARSELAAAVSNAGGFGQMGMVRESPELIAQEIAATRRLTNRPFAVNLIPDATDPKLLDDELAACFHAGVAA